MSCIDHSRNALSQRGQCYRRDVTKCTTARPYRRSWAVLPLAVALLVVALFGGAGFAQADGLPTGGDLQVAQSFDQRDLTIVLRRLTAVPGPLRVQVISHHGDAPGRLTLTASRDDATTTTAVQRATLDLDHGPGSYETTLRVDRPGPWELVLDDGQRVARIPFVAAVAAVSPAEHAVYAGFLIAGIGLIVTVVVATRSRRGWPIMLPAGAVVAGIAIAVTAAILSASVPLPPLPGYQLDPTVHNVTDPYALPKPLVADYSRPPVNLSAATASTAHGTDLTLHLTDAATGEPVDDLVVHDSALLHLILISPAGQLLHRHPLRVSPGHYVLGLGAGESGHYFAAAEFARRGGGVQQVRVPAGIDVGPATGPAGTSAAAENPADIKVAAGSPVAGVPSDITVTYGQQANLQAWLGMTGHMFVVGPLDPGLPLSNAVQGAPVVAHTHAHVMAGMAMNTAMTADSIPDETVATLGPAVTFTFTFPHPGRYRVWAQAERDYQPATVGFTVDVAAADNPGEHHSNNPTASTERYTIVLSPLDFRAGTTAADLIVTDSQGGRATPKQVLVEPVMVSMGHAAHAVVAQPTEPNHYRAADLDLPMAGQWQLTVSIVDENGTQRTTIPVTVTN